MTIRTTGRLVGALFLLAILCYGIGSAIAPHVAGTALMLLNSVVVVTLGALVFRAFRQWHPRAAWVYLAARSIEAVLLAAGIVLLPSAPPEPADMSYQVAMLSLGVGSLPILIALRQARRLPGWLAVWGLVGYALLAIGAVAELLGFAVGLVLSIPGGLFEVILGVVLLYRGFLEPNGTPTAMAAGNADTEVAA